MTSQEYVIWLKGFTEGVHEFNITPKQWDLLKEKLGQVIGDDNKFVETPGMFQVHPQPPYPGVPIGPNGTGTPNMHDLVDRYPWGGQKVWAGTPIDCLRTSTSGYIAPVGQEIPSSVITSGSTGTATYYPANTTVTYTVTTGSGIGVGTTYTNPHGNTVTFVNPQSGSWHYTNSTDKTLLND